LLLRLNNFGPAVARREAMAACERAEGDFSNANDNSVENE
jgi:hypothetical protein